MGFLKHLRGGEPGHEAAESPEIESPGWSAIDRAVEAIYHVEPPFHYGTVVGWRLGGPDPLEGISVYDNPGPPQHWHFVTYGMSELFQKESAERAVSGWGIEFSFRLARKPGEDKPPMWALNFLQNLGRYVFESGNVFRPNHTMDLNGPIALENETAICAACFVEDPQLGSIETPNGSLTFVQVVGLTIDELRAVQGWSVAGMSELLKRGNPLLVTDLARGSALDDPQVAAEAKQRADSEGSSLAGFFADSAEWEAGSGGVRVTVGAIVVDRLKVLLTRRCALGRDAWLRGPTLAIDWAPATRSEWRVDRNARDTLSVAVTPEAARELAAALRAEVGEYRVPSLPGLVIAVQQTIIRDQDGQETARIG